MRKVFALAFCAFLATSTTALAGEKGSEKSPLVTVGIPAGGAASTYWLQKQLQSIGADLMQTGSRNSVLPGLKAGMRVSAVTTAFLAGSAVGEQINVLDEKYNNSAIRTALVDAMEKSAAISTQLKKKFVPSEISSAKNQSVPAYLYGVDPIGAAMSAGGAY